MTYKKDIKISKRQHDEYVEFLPITWSNALFNVNYIYLTNSDGSETNYEYIFITSLLFGKNNEGHITQAICSEYSTDTLLTMSVCMIIGCVTFIGLLVTVYNVEMQMLLMTITISIFVWSILYYKWQLLLIKRRYADKLLKELVTMANEK